MSQALSEVQGPTAVELVDSVALVLLPDAGQQKDLKTWALAEAGTLASIRAVHPDAATAALVAALLVELAESPRPEGFAWRYAFFAGPETPPLWAEVGFSPVGGQGLECWDSMIGTSASAPEGRDISDFELNGLSGRHCIRFAVRSPETGDSAESGELWATAGVVCRRSLAIGLTDVLIAIDTPHLDLLFALLPAVYELATGEMLADAVQAAVA